MVYNFKEFINERYGFELHYYAFDFDDNILHMPTVIHMDKKVGDSWIPTDVSTSNFAKVRNDNENWRLVSGDPVKAFSEFRDHGPRGKGAFLQDVKKALNDNQQGPAWESFIECLTEGAIFSIITARGHEPDSIRVSIEYIIDNHLSSEESNSLYNNCIKHSYIFANEEEFDRIPKGKLTETKLISSYLDSCDYYGVTSEFFSKTFGDGDSSNPEAAKQAALEAFIKKCNKFGKMIGSTSVSVGFSDDDPGNVEHVRTFFKEKSALYNKLSPHKVKFNLYDTSNRNIKGGVRDKFHPVSESDAGAPGLQSSIMPFTSFNNLADKYSPADTSDIGGGNFVAKRAVKFLNERDWLDEGEKVAEIKRKERLGEKIKKRIKNKKPSTK